MTAPTGPAIGPLGVLDGALRDGPAGWVAGLERAGVSTF